MRMTVQALVFLHLLKKAQADESKVITILVTQDLMEMGVLLQKGETRTTSIIEISKFRNSIDSILEFLQNEGYISYGELPNHRPKAWQVKVNHSGWHIAQTMLCVFCSSLIKSVIVPIAVAFLTAIITQMLFSG